MIRLVNVTQHYGVRPVLQSVDLEIDSHGVIAIVGPNGMGKTTLLSVMAGVLSPQRGYVEIDGRKRRGSTEDEIEIRRRVVFLPDRPWLPKQRTGREYLLAIGALYGVESERLLNHIDRLLELFNLSREGDWPIRSFSNGQQKKLALAGAFITDAKILLLDEPFGGGLDPAGILALRHVLRRLSEDRDYTVVLTAPAPEIVNELADRFVVLKGGRVVAFDTLDGIQRQTGLTGSLSDVMAKLIHPETLDNVE